MSLDSNLAELTENPRGLGGCRGTVMVVVGLALLVWSAYNGFRDLHYAISSRQTTGNVTYSWTSPGRYGSTPLCYYQFTVDGKTYEGKDGNHTEGQQLLIAYMPGDPEENRSADARAWLPYGPVGLIVGLFLIVYGGVLLWKADDLLKD